MVPLSTQRGKQKMQIKIISLVTPLFEKVEGGRFMGSVKFGRGKTAFQGDVWVGSDEAVILNSDVENICMPKAIAEGWDGDDALVQAVLEVVKADRKPAKWTKELVREFLNVSDAWVVKGVSTIYRFQTEAEKASETTTDDNGVGFNGLDAELLSSFAKGIEQYGSLTDGQMVWARKKMLKYSGQLAKIANGEIR